MKTALRALLTWVIFSTAAVAQDADAAAVARVVYYSSPHCPFCGLVAERDLAPLQGEHGSALELRVIDTSLPEGRDALEGLWRARSVPSDRRGVPTVVIGEHTLVGAREIPDQLPVRLRAALAAGGVAWPELPGIDATSPASSGLSEATSSPVGDTWHERLHRDVPGNYVALGLLAAMLALAGVMLPRRPWQERLSRATPKAAKVGVAFVGLGAALYLSWGDLTEHDLVCGPVGQCNVVQHSDMAMLLGVIPLAVLGALGYAAILAVYLLGPFGPKPLRDHIPLVILGMSGPGFLFSMLLTFWQPFIIGATCAWCLLSALTMSLTCLLSLGEGRAQLLAVWRRGELAV